MLLHLRRCLRHSQGNVCALIGVALLLMIFVGIPLLGTMPPNDGDGLGEGLTQATDVRHCGCSNPSSVDAVFVIDALRANVWRNESMFPQVAALRQRGAVWERGFVATAPTVTLPKLETIVRGRDGAFLDVLRNFMDDVGTLPEASPSGSQLWYPRGAAVPCNHPSAANDVMYALSCQLPGSGARHRRVAFYGDDTWLRMYPNTHLESVFVDAEGVTSFDVHDATEVDDNVTRHLVSFLDCVRPRGGDGTASRGAVADCGVDLVWMHFLGYDHIGHVEDPRTSTRVPKKLHEMDHLIAMTAEALCRVHASATVTVLSDHGMAVGGGHGGATQEERSVVYARIACSTVPSASVELALEEAAMGVAWPQVDVSQMLLLSLSRVAPATPQREPACQAMTLPHSLGVVAPSFVAAACDAPLAVVGSGSSRQDALSNFQAAKRRQAERIGGRGHTSMGTKAWYLLVLGSLLACSLWCSPLGREPLPLVLWSLVEGVLLPLSSSFAEEMVCIRSSVAMLVVLLERLAGHGRRDKNNARQLSLTQLLGALVVIRLASTSVFPSGVKWKTLAAQPEGNIWSWRVLGQWWEAYAAGGERLLGRHTVSLLWLMTVHPFETVAVGGAVGVVLCGVLRPNVDRNVRREGLLLLLSLVAMPLTVPHLMMTASLYVALRSYLACRDTTTAYRLLAPVLLCECAFGAYGRSILVNDVFFAHLISSSVGRHNALLRAVGGVGVLAWHNAGRLLFMAAAAGSPTFKRHVPLRDVANACLLRSIVIVTGAAMVALAMEGHLFYWSVFLPNLMFAQADLVFFVLVSFLLILW